MLLRKKEEELNMLRNSVDVLETDSHVVQMALKEFAKNAPERKGDVFTAEEWVALKALFPDGGAMTDRLSKTIRLPQQRNVYRSDDYPSDRLRR
ncbi:hypothetical protein SPFM8_00044 [Salmonella phage SPFM8]|nr:hypothetical protein SPFM8_00044 [Salmonella phage SPFM8]